MRNLENLIAREGLSSTLRGRNSYLHSPGPRIGGAKYRRSSSSNSPDHHAFKYFLPRYFLSIDRFYNVSHEKCCYSSIRGTLKSTYHGHVPSLYIYIYICIYIYIYTYGLYQGKGKPLPFLPLWWQFSKAWWHPAIFRSLSFRRIFGGPQAPIARLQV